MEEIFYACNSLKSLNLSSFNTTSVRNMKGMFSGCSELVSLDLSNFNFTSISNVEDMFSGCSELDYVNLYNFHDINETGNMFSGVKDNLVFCIGDESKERFYNLKIVKF
jgi:surface protein